MIWGKAGKYRQTQGGHLGRYPGDLDTIRSQCHHHHQHRPRCRQLRLRWLRPCTAWAGLGSLTVADCPWPVLANICKHCTAQAPSPAHGADMCERRINNITVHRQFLKATNAIRISLNALQFSLLRRCPNSDESRDRDKECQT